MPTNEGYYEVYSRERNRRKRKKVDSPNDPKGRNKNYRLDYDL